MKSLTVAEALNGPVTTSHKKIGFSGMFDPIKVKKQSPRGFQTLDNELDASEIKSKMNQTVTTMSMKPKSSMGVQRPTLPLRAKKAFLADETNSSSSIKIQNGAFASARYPALTARQGILEEDQMYENEDNAEYQMLKGRDEADRRRRLASRQSSMLRDAMMRPGAFKNADLALSSSRNRTISNHK